MIFSTLIIAFLFIKIFTLVINNIFEYIEIFIKSLLFINTLYKVIILRLLVELGL